MRILFVYPNSFLTTSIPLGIAYMSAILKENGHEVELFDTTFYKTGEAQNVKKQELGQTGNSVDYGFFDDVVKNDNELIKDFHSKVLNFNPDIIAFSIVEESWFLAKRLILSLNCKIFINFGVNIIVGGVFPTFAHEKINKEFPDIHICRGEGEYFVKWCCSHCSQREPWKCCFKEVTSITDINTLPFPDYDLFHPKMLYRPLRGYGYDSKLRKTLMIETQRGCPYNCNFCNSQAQKEMYGKGFYRRKSTKRIDEELHYLINRHNPEFVYFVGDSFLSMPEKEWKDFVKMYGKYKLPFWMNTRPETITKERVKDLELMGCVRCNLGIEHGDERFRKEMINRNISNERIVEACKCFEDAKIELVTNNIIGYPGETHESLKDTIKLNKKISKYITSASAFIFTPYHGTKLREYAIKYGYLDESVICSNIWDGSLLYNSLIPPQELRVAQRWFNEIIKG